MLRLVGLLFLTFSFVVGRAQRFVSADEAVQLAFGNQVNLRAANLSLQQQEQLLRGSANVQSPQLQAEASPYEPLVVGVQQTLSLPGVYRNRRSLQAERINLARLQLQGSQYDLKRAVRLSYLQLQFLSENLRLLQYQDSIYKAIKSSSKRFFEAGQINKLEELQAATQADRVTNNLMRTLAEMGAEQQIFRFYTGLADSFIVEHLQSYVFAAPGDTLAITNIQQQILQQQIAINQRQLQVNRAELLPQVQSSILFPTTKEYVRAVGYQVGISIPLWQRQNRSRIAAAQSAVEVARAQQQLEQQRLNAQYRQAFVNYEKELQSLTYFNNTALPQARAIMETSQRLFQGGQLNYIESLRNLQTAFDIFFSHVQTHRAFNEAVIQLNYLNGTL
ncbi:MAG TPA: TolC family protein [Chitinophagaceae bacterium]|nr:TolC family protein [Chitinophagaceae bacterium]